MVQVIESLEATATTAGEAHIGRAMAPAGCYCRCRSMLRYWFALIQGRFKLWQLLLLGALWVAGGVTMQWMLGGREMIPVAALFALSGIAHWVIAWRAVRLHDQTAERIEELEARGKQPAEPPPRPEPAPRLAPPRIGDDPFRNPPAPPPIVVLSTAAPAAAPPIVPGANVDKPKILG